MVYTLEDLMLFYTIERCIKCMNNDGCVKRYDRKEFEKNTKSCHSAM